ncbi:MAG: orotidine-5'-phosphate decarboxylase [Sphingomonadaceae bacterium]
MENPVFLAVDTTDPARARALLKAAGPHVGGVKLGLEWYCANGNPATQQVMQACGLPLFLDLKFHDIPNTVAGAIRAVAPLAPALLSVHAAGGPAMLRAAREAAPWPTRLVAVSVLTSLDEADVAAIGMRGPVADAVVRLADVARAAGIDGMVCSPHEVTLLRARWPDALLVVPGVRPDGGAAFDQKRVMTPREALDAGASHLVIGRPITAAPDPAQAAREIAASLGCG